MTNNIFICYDNARISEARGGQSYKVELEDEEYIIFIKKETVQKIYDKTHLEESLIATLLAYIEYTRITLKSEGKRKPKKIGEETIIKSVSAILNSSHPIEAIIEWVRPLKWYEINQILDSENPLVVMEEII